MGMKLKISTLNPFTVHIVRLNHQLQDTHSCVIFGQCANGKGKHDRQAENGVEKLEFNGGLMPILNSVFRPRC